MRRPPGALLSAVALFGATSCGEGASTAIDPATTVASGFRSVEAVVDVEPPLDALIGFWAIDVGTDGSNDDGADGLVAFNLVVDGQAVSVAQNDCYLFGDLIELADGQIRLVDATLEQTPAACDPGPPSDRVAAILDCLQQGCEIVTVSADAVTLGGDPAIRLTRLADDGGG